MDPEKPEFSQREDLANLEKPDLEEIGEREGYVLNDVSLAHERGLKTTADGQIILIPQPSDSPNDPLNWTPFKKHLVLIIISCTAFLPDYGSATGAVTLTPQGEEWNMSPNTVNHSQVGNVFMLGAAGPIVVAFAAYFGRYPVLFWWTLFALATAIWCAAAQSFESFMAARILNGFFSTVAQGGGLMFVKDMFFLHEHARKINIWSGFIILSPYMGPLFGSFIVNTQIWQWAFGVYAIETGLCLIAIILFVDETYYDRKTIQPELVPNGPRWQRMLGIQQVRTKYIKNSFKDACMRPVTMLRKPVIVLIVIAYMLMFAWVVGINTTLSIFLAPKYGFGAKAIGFFYFTPIVAAIIGEICGHWLHDFIAKTYTKRNNNHLDPEARLYAIWFAMPFLVPGLILLGFALERHYHYMLAALGWGLYVFGIMIVTVAVNSYVLDAYPEASGEVAAWVNFGRTTGGFIVSYFMVEWAQKEGTIKQFGTMCGIVGAAFFIVLALQVWGKELRAWSGPARFKTA
ncbi:major facilitator superfamily domain-containing protein [Penicillium pulvis]|uniref:major facilitator superfamily domain-containing protein n=1 Tax=Penicillium pulvis TaxID=1562058 RepID=UPI0025487F3C|nr:major facilitator superfamily domain-containing protein [Penicillium pulvis]KAJ5805754.1 major facilitator superfamily domain-containing protein [Penicillium pulvis]